MAFIYDDINRKAHDPERDVTIVPSTKFYDTSELPYCYESKQCNFTFLSSFKYETKTVTLKNGKISEAKIPIEAHIQEKPLWMTFALSGCGIEFAKLHYDSVKNAIEEGMFCLEMHGEECLSTVPKFRVVFVPD
ncbi:hypothetical protein [Collimonas fungivorans]|uniref:hypothetical protein n=1 Tax=Collimonas fungivorans TaxID=158899 RepID=UPI00059FE4C2|nr:hypothetical protein [Collimonas fungivorans]